MGWHREAVGSVGMQCTVEKDSASESINYSHVQQPVCISVMRAQRQTHLYSLELFPQHSRKWPLLYSNAVSVKCTIPDVVRLHHESQECRVRSV